MAVRERVGVRQETPQRCDGCGTVDGCRCPVAGGVLAPRTAGPNLHRCECGHPQLQHPYLASGVPGRCTVRYATRGENCDCAGFRGGRVTPLRDIALNVELGYRTVKALMSFGDWEEQVDRLLECPPVTDMRTKWERGEG